MISRNYHRTEYRSNPSRHPNAITMTQADLVQIVTQRQPRNHSFPQRTPQPSKPTPEPSSTQPQTHPHQPPISLRQFFTTASASTDPSSPPSQDVNSQPITTGGTDDFLPSTTLTNRFKNFYRMATGSMSPTGQAAYWADADARYSEIDCKRCEDQRDYLLQYSPIVRYMSDQISRLGGDLNRENIRCRTCATGQLGGFDHKYGILLCANYIDKRSMLEDVLSHEMVHAWDHLRFKTSLSHDASLREVACSEIRASNLSGECRWSNEFFRNKVLKFNRHHQDCVRRRAVISVKMRPNCPDDLTAVKVVNEVWDSCSRDTRPFDEIYR